MTQEQPAQPELLDLPEDVQQAYDATVDAVIDRLAPNTSLHARETNKRLYSTFERVFDALSYTPPEGGTLVELGMGPAPYLATVQAAFHPAEHVGIEIRAGSVDALRAAYPNLPPTGHGSVRAVVADAVDPSAIPGFETGRQVDEVIALHPDVSMAGKTGEDSDDTEPSEDEEDFVADPAMLNQMHNWRQRLAPDGLMVVINVFREEAEAIVSDPRLNPYVHLYGLTAALSDSDMPDAAYVVTLRATPRDGEPIVWKRELYRAYQEGAIHSPNENMFPNEAE